MPSSLARDLTEDRRKVWGGKAKVASRRSADQEVIGSDFIAHRSSRGGTNIEPDPGQFGPVIGMAGCRQRCHHGG